jgi:hypothetical protein
MLRNTKINNKLTISQQLSNCFIDIPVITPSRSSNRVLYGTYVLNIDCVISSPYYPLLFVVWQKTTNGVTTQLNVASSNGKYNGSTILNPALTIYNIVYTDSGSYLCYAANVIGIGHSSLYLLSVEASKSVWNDLI